LLSDGNENGAVIGGGKDQSLAVGGVFVLRVVPHLLEEHSAVGAR